MKRLIYATRWERIRNRRTPWFQNEGNGPCIAGHGPVMVRGRSRGRPGAALYWSGRGLTLIAQGSDSQHSIPTTLAHPTRPGTAPEPHRSLTVDKIVIYGEATACIRRVSGETPMSVTRCDMRFGLCNRSSIGTSK